jgi:hypothetical protein
MAGTLRGISLHGVIRRTGGRFIIAVAAAVALVVLTTGPAIADGGTLRVANAPIGAYRINVFTSPTPIPPDSIDVSILATERGRGLVSDLEITVRAHPVGQTGRSTSHPATRDQATDPRYYAAKFAPGSVGAWEIVVQVSGPRGEGEVRFEVMVQEPGPMGSPFLILGLALLPLLLVGWWLKKSG